MHRLFAAIRPPEAVVDRLTQLMQGYPGRRTVDPDNLHLTLAFFGEIDGAAAQDIASALERVRPPRFDLTLDRLGMFGGGKPRTVHAAAPETPALTHLRDKVRQAARETGLDLPHERFAPHVTLARVKPGDPVERIQRWVAERSMFFAGPFEVAHFMLYRSHLGREGPIYQGVRSYPLS